MSAGLFMTRLVWVAAHHGLRKASREHTMQPRQLIPLWSLVHDLTSELGHPTSPGAP